MQKNCNKLPNNINKWNIECIYLCFLPIPYNTAPTVYAIPPNNSKTKPAVPSNSGNNVILNTIHHPITK